MGNTSTQMTTDVYCYNETQLQVVGYSKYYEGYETDENRINWWFVDYTCDLIYILDIIVVKSRVKFIKDGMMEVKLLYSVTFSV